MTTTPNLAATPLGRREKRKQTNRARNRLLSIRRDAENLSRTLCHICQDNNTPIIGNERCGSWYIDTRTTQMDDTCYFKSSDGHTKSWNFSLKRLNLNVIRIVASAASNSSCAIVDASASKDMPDSLSRTVPIWACVLNRLTARYREQLGLSPPDTGWDIALYTPSLCVPSAEHAVMESIIDERVWAAYESQAIVDPQWLVTTLRKPLRPTWILSNSVAVEGRIEESTATQLSSNQYFSLLCVTCSDPHRSSDTGHSFRYSPGAADDHETWARGLTPSLFWSHCGDLLDHDAPDDDSLDATDAAIDRLVATISLSSGEETLGAENVSSKLPLFDSIGELGLAIGSRRAGRPPECWDSFDAVLNVTEQSYEDVLGEHSQGEKYYLQLPVREGKCDKIELERWMSVGIVFVAIHASYGRRMLIHCAQGKDRSVALAMASVMVLCDSLTLPLRWRDSVLVAIRDQFGAPASAEAFNTDELLYEHSGMTQVMVNSLLGQQGRDTLLSFVRANLGSDLIPANKDTLRLALLLIQQDRDKADPSRSTMQKLNRFFMSKIMFTP